jgi:hypothetical protein
MLDPRDGPDMTPTGEDPPDPNDPQDDSPASSPQGDD